MRLKPVGITGVMCVLGDEICNETRLAVSALASALQGMQIPGVIETVPSFTSLMVRYNPALTDYAAVCRAVTEAEKNMASGDGDSGRLVEIPVCYGGEFGPDLAFVAEHAGLSEREVIRLHTSCAYPIYMLGFLPGFPYLGGLDPRLFTPRLTSPRKAIPTGSVGIGGQQTGIYPMESPGGWQLIGRTPLKLFDPSKPLLYRAGDSIRFIEISEQEYYREAEKWQLK